MTARTFLFARSWIGAGCEPHFVVVRGRGHLDAGYNTSESQVVEIAYTGGGWSKFLHVAGDTLGIGKCSEQVLTEVICERALSTPLVVYVPNAGSLAKECGDELVRFIAFWESFVMYGASAPYPMLLALQFPERPE